jgi:hypothetical protein
MQVTLHQRVPGIFRQPSMQCPTAHGWRDRARRRRRRDRKPSCLASRGRRPPPRVMAVGHAEPVRPVPRWVPAASTGSPPARLLCGQLPTPRCPSPPRTLLRCPETLFTGVWGHRSFPGLWLVVPAGVQVHVSEEFSARAEHADVQIVDEDGYAGVAAPEADVVEPAVVTQGQRCCPGRAGSGRRSSLGSRRRCGRQAAIG